MDQQGCSSPQAVFWVGKRNYKTVDLFWQNLKLVVMIKNIQVIFSGKQKNLFNL